MSFFIGIDACYKVHRVSNIYKRVWRDGCLFSPIYWFIRLVLFVQLYICVFLLFYQVDQGFFCGFADFKDNSDFFSLSVLSVT